MLSAELQTGDALCSQLNCKLVTHYALSWTATWWRTMLSAELQTGDALCSQQFSQTRHSNTPLLTDVDDDRHLTSIVFWPNHRPLELSNPKAKGSNTGYQSKGSKKLYYLNSVRAQQRGTRWPIWLRHCAISPKVEGSLEFFIDLILPTALWPWG
jgi:hypothetical protein